MNARGTRRPHPRRVRSKPRRTKSSGGGGKGMGCAVLVVAFFAAPLTAAVWLAFRA